MVGGSGLYVESIVCDYRIADVAENREFRDRLVNIPLEQLVARLEQEDPELAERTDTSNGRRVVRALEIAEHARSAPVQFSERPGIDLSFSVFCIDVERSQLRRRIGDRLRSRIASGMVEEVRGLLDRGLSHERLEALGLEYREIAAYLRGVKSLDDMLNDLGRAIGRFAKRQQTWFRGMERRGVPIHWIKPNDMEKILDTVRAHHGSAN
jgi:tRNA dimethylallyltransferase